ncbi:MAG: tetratricopeptide repeat protein [Candidatus Zixiibacteriota bacterium]
MEILFGNYQIIEELAQGGMGKVFRATQLSLQRPVAIKQLSTRLSSNPHFIARFEKEAISLGILSNENIVGALDFGKTDNAYYIVMEFIDGIDLKILLEAKKLLDPNTSMTILEQIARGLSYAHEKNILHRDIKPANIILSRDGVIKITDFGLCQFVDDSDDLTLAGTVMGTPRYMSPEQAMGAELDERSDIYSLGLLFYELLTGEFAIHGFSTRELLNQQINGSGPDFKELPKNVHRKIKKIIKKCVIKDSKKRYKDLSALLYDIRKIRQSHKKFKEQANLAELFTDIGLKKEAPDENKNLSLRIKKIRKSLDSRLDDSHLPEETAEISEIHALKLSKIDDISKTDFIIKNTDIFIKNPEFDYFVNSLKNKQSTLIIGRPVSGKSRIIFEALSSLISQFEGWNILILKAENIIDDKTLNKLCSIDRLIVIWEDIDKYISEWNPEKMLLKLKQDIDQLIIIGSIRTGSEYSKVERQIPDWFYLFDENIKINDIKDKDAVKLAKSCNGEIKYFDGTPGSIVMDLLVVKSRYTSLKRPAKEVLQSIKLLYLIDIKNPERDIIKDILHEIFEIELDRNKLRKILKELIKNSFIIQNGKNYSFYHKIYIKKVITDFEIVDIEEEMDVIIDVISKSKKSEYIESLTRFFWDRNNFEIMNQMAKLYITNAPDSDMAFMLQAIALSNLGLNEKALENINKSIQLKPQNIDLYNQRGLIYQRVDRYEEALQDFNYAIKLQPDFGACYNNRAILYSYLGDHEKAMQDYDKAISINPNMASLYNNRAVEHFKIKDTKGAFEDLEKCIEKDPEHGNAITNRGLLKKMSGDIEGARNDFEKAIKVAPLNPHAHTNHAHLMKIEKRYSDALNDHSKAFELFQNKTRKAKTLAACAIIYAKLDNKERALKTFETAEKMDSKAVLYNKLCLLTEFAKEDEEYINKAFELLEIILDDKKIPLKWLQQDEDLEFLRNFPRYKELVNSN